MTKTTITHACAHRAVHNLTGPGRQRDSREVWLAGQPCRDCLNAAETAVAAQANAGLPALTGTDKQIAWAETLRAKALAELDAVLDKLAKGEQPPPTPETAYILEGLHAAVAALKAQTQARVWIDNRHKPYGIIWVQDAIAATRRAALNQQDA
jgi:hypothetical protein